MDLNLDGEFSVVIKQVCDQWWLEVTQLDGEITMTPIKNPDDALSLGNRIIEAYTELVGGTKTTMEKWGFAHKHFNEKFQKNS